jgi:hypothetical protein
MSCSTISFIMYGMIYHLKSISYHLPQLLQQNPFSIRTHVVVSYYINLRHMSSPGGKRILAAPNDDCELQNQP